MTRIVIVLALCSYSAQAAGAHGYLFPTPGEVTMTTAIGVPYLAVSEISVGITDGFSAGVLLIKLKSFTQKTPRCRFSNAPGEE